jgi:hypothetical protein
MSAIPNKVVVGDEADPILTFYNDNIISLTEETATSLIGEELFIDQFVPVVKFGLLIRYEICPADRENYDRILTKEGLILCGKYTYDIRKIPYGTPVRFYTNNRIAGLYYCDNVERIGKEKFQINCISAIGLMNRQRHHGGIYTGERFDAVVREIIGEEYDFQIEPDVASLQVYGWLPYSTRRRNLHQLLVAYGVNITKSDIGGMLFTFLKAVDAEEIPNSRIFSGGDVTYGEPASRLEVIEHGFHYLSSVDYEVLYDTQGEMTENTIVTFDRPIYAESLVVEEGGNLTISSYGTNFAVVSGTGILKGKPYVHTTKRLTVDNEEAITEKIVTIEEATLVTMANAENVLARLSAYYFHATTVTNSIKVDTERTGKRYIIENAFGEHTNAFLAKTSTRVSSFARADCEFVADYVPIAQGQAFGKRDILELTDAEQIWTVPDSVYEKDNPQIRVVLIGEGYDGENGQDGTAGEAIRGESGGAGGKGGKGGAGGKGGKILSGTIDCSNLAFLRYGKTGKNSWLYAGDDYYNSGNGASSSSGFVELFTGAVFALPGTDGVGGGDGGAGGTYPPIAQFGTATQGENGGDVEFNGETYKGGAAASRMMATGSQLGITSYMHVHYGGSGGGGAAAGSKGGDAVKGWAKVNGSNVWGKGGDGADALAAEPTVTLYGSGGNGGSGGGGGGGAASEHWWNSAYTTLISVDSQGRGAGGKGSAGTKGYRGCIIIYY